MAFFFFSPDPAIAIWYFFKAIKLNNQTISAYFLYTTIDTICNINIIAKFKNKRNHFRNIEKFDVRNYKSGLGKYAIKRHADYRRISVASENQLTAQQGVIIYMLTQYSVHTFPSALGKAGGMWIVDRPVWDLSCGAMDDN